MEGIYATGKHVELEALQTKAVISKRVFLRVVVLFGLSFFVTWLFV